MLPTLARTVRTGRCASARSLSAAARRLKATAFDMPAMSPTMTEGGIVDWKYKPGDAFSAGDELLEIETDKAQISVEAQDDGVLAKIIIENGAKGVPVGTPIAVLAEPDDDISSIDFDAIVSAKDKSSSKSKQTKASEEKSLDETVISEKRSEPANDSAPPSSGSSGPSNGASGSEFTGKGAAASLPSVLRLCDAAGIDASTIKGTGPNGRILKGDVLVALGKIPADKTQSLSERIDKRSHLDLSEAIPFEKPSQAAKNKPAPPQPTVVEEEIPLAGLLEVAQELRFSLARALKKAERLAIRDSIIAQKPRASVLRSSALDALTASAPKVPYSVELSVVKVGGVAESVIAEVVVAPELKTRGEPAAAVFLSRFAYYLGEGAGELLI